MNTVGKLLKMAKSVEKDHRTIRTVVSEEVGVPCVKVDTPDLKPGDEVEVTIGHRESEKEIVKQYLEKGERCREQSEESQTYAFWDGFHNCAENILRELE